MLANTRTMTRRQLDAELRRFVDKAKNGSILVPLSIAQAAEDLRAQLSYREESPQVIADRWVEEKKTLPYRDFWFFHVRRRIRPIVIRADQ